MNTYNYILRDSITEEDLLKNGFRQNSSSNYFSKLVTLKSSIVLCLKINLQGHELTIDVLDDDFCQPYTPFYDYIDGKINLFSFLKDILGRYKEEMNKIKCIIPSES